MRNELQVRPRDQQLPALAAPATGYDEPGPPPESIFTKIHRLLRGHYKWCIPAAMILGVAGGIAGFRTARPLWTSTGVVQVSSVVSPIITKTFENAELPQQFKDTQMALMRSQRVIDLAMQSEEWKALGRDIASDAALAEFLDKLKITSLGRSDIINVTFTDEDPKAAVAGAKSVVTAYSELYVDREEKNRLDKQRQLQSRRDMLSGQMRTKQEILKELAMRRFGTDDLRTLHTAMVENIARLKGAIDEGNIELAALNATIPATQQIQKKMPTEMTAEDIAATDEIMRKLLKELDDARFDLESLLAMGRFGENHAEVRTLRTAVQRRQYEVERYEKQWHERMDNSGDMIELKDPALLKRDQLEMRQSKYAELLKHAEAESQDLGRDMFELERLRKEIEHLEKLIAETDERLDELRTEVQDRVIIVSKGDRAVMLKNNKIQYAIAGSMGGASVALGLAMLISMLDRRLRTPEDARTGSKLTLLGVLPNLPENLADPEQAAVASHCVHQIRTLLQIVPERRVLAVTSPVSGTGKTSLTLSLGVSFAAANFRTLLIDCDLIGGGLTARVDAIAQRKLGRILIQQGLIDERQLQTALKLSGSSRKRLGEMLIELGFVTEADVQQALALQSQALLGILDVLQGEKLEDCVAASGIEGLAILPLGSAVPNDVSRLSTTVMRTLIEQARRSYDFVLIDTGPIPGSLEASIVAACADAVVLVVSRGEQRNMAERSIQHLQDIAAPIAGVVFNRAESQDIELSTTANRVSSAATYGSAPRGERRETAARGQSGMGPMTMAVTSRSPVSRNSSRPQE